MLWSVASANLYIFTFFSRPSSWSLFKSLLYVAEVRMSYGPIATQSSPSPQNIHRFAQFQISSYLNIPIFAKYLQLSSTYPQISKEYHKAAKSKQWQKKRTTQILPKARHTWDLGACYQNACWGDEGLGIICTLLERRCHFLVCKQCTSNASSENSVKSMQSIVVQCYFHL